MKRQDVHDDAELLRRLMQRRVIDPVTGCWIWPGGQSGPGYRQRNGYGVMWNGVRPERITHMVARVYLGYVEGKGHVCHHCDCPPCWNPAHLFIGTHKDNMQDSIRKGRFNPGHVPGEKNGQAKVTAMQVEEIRTAYATGESQQQIANRYGLNQAHVSRIVRHANWKAPQEVLH